MRAEVKNMYKAVVHNGKSRKLAQLRILGVKPLCDDRSLGIFHFNAAQIVLQAMIVYSQPSMILRIYLKIMRKSRFHATGYCTFGIKDFQKHVSNKFLNAKFLFYIDPATNIDDLLKKQQEGNTIYAYIS